MKKLRKLLSVAAATLVAASLAVTTTVSSFAADKTYSITITGTNENHTYEAYQIFTGKLDVVDGAKILTDIQWGEGVESDALLDALSKKYPSVFKEEMSATEASKAITKDAIKDIAQIIGKNLSGTYTSSAKASGTTAVIEELPVGYYLVKDADESLKGKDEAYTSFIIKVVGDADAVVKSDKPTFEKKVLDDDDDVTADEGYNDVADYSIGDDVPFRLKATLPSNIGDYDSYKLVFNDTMSEGLTYKAVSKITVGGVDVTDQVKGGIAGEGQSLTVTIENLMDLTDVDIKAGTEVIVYFTATLNSSAKTGNAEGNPNEAYLEYSNNPNVDGEGETGTTTKDKVVVFTYELDVEKVDGSNDQPLKDAEFKLKNAEGKWLVVDENGKVKEWVNDEENASTLKTGEDGYIKVIGLDEGTYYLKETKAPSGYNLLTDLITLEIEAADDHVNEYGDKTAAELCPSITIEVDNGDPEDGDATTGTVSTKVENNKGSSLPETGGIGTTIFFVGGGIVVAVAAILLIVKRRMREVA